MWGVVCAAKNRDAQGDDIRQHQLGQYPVVKRAGFCPGCFFVVFGFFFLLLSLKLLSCYLHPVHLREILKVIHTCRAHHQVVGVKPAGPFIQEEILQN